MARGYGSASALPRRPRPVELCSPMAGGCLSRPLEGEVHVRAVSRIRQQRLTPGSLGNSGDTSGLQLSLAVLRFGELGKSFECICGAAQGRHRHHQRARRSRPSSGPGGPHAVGGAGVRGPATRHERDHAVCDVPSHALLPQIQAMSAGNTAPDRQREAELQRLRGESTEVSVRMVRERIPSLGDAEVRHRHRVGAQRRSPALDRPGRGRHTPAAAPQIFALSFHPESWSTFGWLRRSWVETWRLRRCRSGGPGARRRP